MYEAWLFHLQSNTVAEDVQGPLISFVHMQYDTADCLAQSLHKKHGATFI